MDQQFPQTKEWKQEVENLELFMIYVKESLKFILFSFFKRCRLIIKILEKQHKEVRQDTGNPLPRAVGGAPSQKQTRESIIADMLAQNLKWAFLTILTCIEKSEDHYKQDKLVDINVVSQRLIGGGGNDETMDMQNLGNDLPIMSDLVCFKMILYSLLDGLNYVGTQDYKKNS